jgi:Tol biopolymer transport system component
MIMWVAAALRSTVRQRGAGTAAALLAVVSAVAVAPGRAGAGPPVPGTAMVSVSSTGAPSDSFSFGAAVSADGRYVAFNSDASTLVPGDTNGTGDVFVRDLRHGTTSRVSVSGTGAQGEGDSAGPAISADGRYVAFSSLAGNLVPGDSGDGHPEVLVRDRVAGTTTRISRSAAGGASDGASVWPAFSGNGRYVAFTSYATNLVAGDTNGVADVFRHDLRTKKTALVSVTGDGAQADDISLEPAISRSGRYVTYYSLATNLAPGDTDEVPDVFVRDLDAGTTTLVSVVAVENGTEAWGHFTPDISADGRRVAFMSTADNLVAGDTNHNGDIFVRDLDAGTTTLVSVSSTGRQSTETTEAPAISADGRHVAFAGRGDTFAEGDTNEADDVFVHDAGTGRTTRVSVSATGSQAGDGSTGPAIDAHGRRIAFTSYASDLVPDDRNGQPDVFVHTRR